MSLPTEGCLLRIFIGESDKHAGIPLYDWIVKQARDRELAGATVIRCLAGFGTHGHLHTAKFMRQSTDLPVIVEIVDSREKIEALLSIVEAGIGDGLATLEKVETRFYRSDS
jgi:PII-like signaling protein